MINEKSRWYFLLTCLGLSLILTFFVLRPFLYSLILASVFAIVFQPLYKRILRRAKDQSWLAAFLTVLVLIGIILVPITVLTVQIFQEAQNLYLTMINDLGNHTLGEFLTILSQKLIAVSPAFDNLSPNVDQYIQNVLDLLVQNLGAIFSNLAKIFVSLFVFLVAFFFLLKDGDKLKQKIADFSPLSKGDNGIIIEKITLAINSVIKGSLLVAILQGISSAIGFILFGVPNPIIWGALAAVGALVPGVGTSLVLAPAIIYLYLTGQLVSAIGLLVWGILAVGLIDNLLGPKLVGQGTGLHPLLILLSVLGGLSLFGPIGFILGPLVISLVIVLLDIYASIVK